eukprot:1545676-Pyramimonas_sp.AAC.1
MAVCQVKVIRESSFAPHSPVQVVLHPRLGRLQAHAFRRPPPLPTAPLAPVQVLEVLPPSRRVHVVLESARAAAGQGDWKRAQGALDRAC